MFVVVAEAVRHKEISILSKSRSEQKKKQINERHTTHNTQTRGVVAALSFTQMSLAYGGERRFYSAFY